MRPAARTAVAMSAVGPVAGADAGPIAGAAEMLTLGTADRELFKTSVTSATGLLEALEAFFEPGDAGDAGDLGSRAIPGDVGETGDLGEPEAAEAALDTFPAFEPLPAFLEPEACTCTRLSGPAKLQTLQQSGMSISSLPARWPHRTLAGPLSGSSDETRPPRVAAA
mmetsp:Transcript_51153/g.115983  ORF Transcript_51153/g.115983 Transcript_51153/m.115983 type:complete len:167 (+) Transcript_51153:174-674(+)